jgi:hypothetical protein
MANTFTSPNMNLTIPIVGQDPGPDYGNNLVNDLSLIDSHDHSLGQGIQITPSGLNINADLPLTGNNLTLVRTVRFTPQTIAPSGPGDVGCLFESSAGDFWYNNSAGVAVQITNGNSIVGASGSISGLVSPASASYVSATSSFVFQSNALVAANLDLQNIILRNAGASSFGLTLSPPNAMGSDISMVLPSIPAATGFMTMNSSGSMSAATPIVGGITQSMLAARSTGTTVGAGGVGITSSCGAFQTPPSNVAYQAVTNFSITITTTGRPVYIGIIPDGSTNNSGFGAVNCGILMQLLRGASVISQWAGGVYASFQVFNPTNGMSYLDVVGAGTYTYTFQIAPNGCGSAFAFLYYAKFIAYEI